MLEAGMDDYVSIRDQDLIRFCSGGAPKSPTDRYLLGFSQWVNQKARDNHLQSCNPRRCCIPI